MMAHRSGVGVASGAVMLVVLIAAASVAGALERSTMVVTALKDGAVHFLGAHDGELYFVNNSELWKTDGTPAGTVLLSNATPLISFSLGSCPVDHPYFARGASANGLFLFSASDGVHGQELWRTDGTPAGTAMVKDVATPHDFVPVGGAVHFQTLPPGNGVWRSDGTDSGTVFLADQTLPVGTLNGVYVFARNGALWRSDGTAPGTVMLAVFDPDGPHEVTFLAKDGGKLYFRPTGSSSSPWVTDGTPAGTVPLVDPISPLVDLIFSTAMVCEAGLCYFVENTSAGVAVWKTDGTPEGTVKIATIADGGARPPIMADGIAYFATNHEVWKTDGTPGGTEALLSFSDPLVFVSSPTHSGGDLFWTVRTPSLEHQLWRSDGTSTGTRQVADLGPAVIPRLVIVDGTLVLGVLGPIPADSAASTFAWKVQRFDRTTEQLSTLAELARNFMQCTSPTCLCSQPPDQSEIVGRHWYFEALDPSTFLPKLWVVTAVYFRDVAPDHWAFSWVESLADAGLTGGCGTDTYCPDVAVSRAEMAVFLLRAIHGASHLPPSATGNVFPDVPANFWAAAFIEELAAEGITGGCGGGLYCPLRSITRAEMAVLLLRAIHGTGFTPPPATGTRFNDVPAGDWAAAWIEQLGLEGITGGCGGGNYCPDAPITRAQMAVFVSRAFRLSPASQGSQVSEPPTRRRP